MKNDINNLLGLEEDENENMSVGEPVQFPDKDISSEFEQAENIPPVENTPPMPNDTITPPPGLIPADEFTPEQSPIVEEVPEIKAEEVPEVKVETPQNKVDKVLDKNTSSEETDKALTEMLAETGKSSDNPLIGEMTDILKRYKDLLGEPASSPKEKEKLEKARQAKLYTNLLSGLMQAGETYVAGSAGTKPNSDVGKLVRGIGEDIVTEAEADIKSNAQERLRKMADLKSELEVSKYKSDLTKLGFDLKDKEQMNDPNSGISKYMKAVAKSRFKIEIPADTTAAQLEKQLKGLVGDKPHYELRTMNDANGRPALYKINVKTGENVLIGRQGGLTDDQLRKAEQADKRLRIQDKGLGIQEEKFKFDQAKEAQFTAAQEKEVSEMKNTLTTIADLDLSALADEKTGPVAGRLRKLADKIGVGKDIPFTRLQNQTASMLVRYIREISGGAVTEDEYKRLSNEMASVSDNPEKFLTVLQNFQDRVSRRLNTKLDTIAKTQSLKKATVDAARISPELQKRLDSKTGARHKNPNIQSPKDKQPSNLVKITDGKSEPKLVSPATAEKLLKYPQVFRRVE